MHWNRCWAQRIKDWRSLSKEDEQRLYDEGFNRVCVDHMVILCGAVSCIEFCVWGCLWGFIVYVIRTCLFCGGVVRTMFTPVLQSPL